MGFYLETAPDVDQNYYIVKVDNNTFKLSDTYYDSTEEKPPIVGITSTSVGTINPINPEIKLSGPEIAKKFLENIKDIFPNKKINSIIIRSHPREKKNRYIKNN